MRLSRSLFSCILLLLASCSSSSEREEYRVARDPTWFPFRMKGREKNLLAFSDDLVREFGNRKEIRFRFVQVGPSFAEQGLQRGEFEAVLTTIQPNAFHRRSYRFSDPFFFTGEVLVVPKGSNVENLRDLRNRRVGIMRGMLSFHEIDGDDSIIYKQYGNVTNAVEEMLRGELEAVILNLIPASALARGIYGERIKIVGAPLTQSGIRLMVLKGKNEFLIEEFNSALRDMLDDGTHRELREKWGLWQQDELRLKIMIEEESNE